MTISITEKEFKALRFAITQIGTDAEAADEDFARDASEAVEALYSISAKYLKKREEANFFQAIRAGVSQHNRSLRPRDIDKLARKLLREKLEYEKRNI